MNAPTEAADLVGRSIKESGQLIRRWFERLTLAAERGDPTAYVFVSGNLIEVLQAFDMPVALPEIYSLQTAVRHVAHDYINTAEDYGYSADICGYVKADVGIQLRGGEHPLAKIPRPSLVIASNFCNTYIKWAEIWERLYQTPVFVLDLPSTREAYHFSEIGSPGFERDRRYVEHQVRELIGLCEQVTGKKFDIDKLREALHHSNQMAASYRRMIELNRNVPAVLDAVTDGTAYLGVANALRGTPEGSAFFAAAVEELEYKAAHGIGVLPEEKYRLIFVGVPCYPIYRRFREMFTEHGGVFVNSTYMHFASGGFNYNIEYDLEHPIESLAAGALYSGALSMDKMFFIDQPLAEMSREYRIDGIVFHPIKSCRTVSTGLADARQAVMRLADVMTLYVESDHMDRRVVSEAQLKNRVDAFFEGMATRKLQRAASREG